MKAGLATVEECSKGMTANRSLSEEAFAAYLDQNSIQYDHPFTIDPDRNTNVDFALHLAGDLVLADVKDVTEVYWPDAKPVSDRQIQGDIRKLRDKFRTPAKRAVVLVTVNRSMLPLTGYIVITAMLGSARLLVNTASPWQRSPLHHDPKGNAAVTKTKNQTLSGILVFQPAGQHHYYANPYASEPLIGEPLPGVIWHYPRKTETEGDLIGNLDDEFWPVLPPLRPK